MQISSLEQKKTTTTTTTTTTSFVNKKGHVETCQESRNSISQFMIKIKN